MVAVALNGGGKSRALEQQQMEGGTEWEKVPCGRVLWLRGAGALELPAAESRFPALVRYHVTSLQGLAPAPRGSRHAELSPEQA